MSDEFVAGWLAMPTWAQYFVGYFVLMVVVMFAEPMWRQHRVSRRFSALAKALGATVTPGSDSSVASFEIEREGRRFTVRREWRHAPRSNSTYRGPRGHLLFCDTPLVGDNWKGHGVDIAEEAALPLQGMRPFRTGDAAFDERFKAWQDGVPVRSDWLDAAARGAVTAFFDTTPLSGALWVREGVLQYVGDAPKGVAAPVLEEVLRAQCAIALAFEQTAAHEAAFQERCS